MKNKTMQLAFVLLFLAVATNVAKGQVCNIIRNSSFDQGGSPFSPAPGSTITSTGTNVSFWTTTVAGEDPDVYPGYRIFMWDNNASAGAMSSDEFIFQNLCQNIVKPSPNTYNLSFDALTTTRGLGNGRLEVFLSNGTTHVLVATVPNLTLSMTNYQFVNITASIANGTYNRIIIRPVSNNNAVVMDIIVDNIVLGTPMPAAGTKYLKDVVCCQANDVTYPGSMEGVSELKWIDMATGLVIGTTPTINVTPAKSGSAYLVQKYFASCAGNCMVTDTVVLRCCGGDNDWEFSDPNGITSADQIHRTGDVNIGNLAIVPGAPDIAKVEIKNNDNAKWNCFMLNGAGNGKMLRIKGGFYQGQHSIFQVEANGATDYTEDNVRLMVRADGRVGIGTTTPSGTLHVNGDTWNTSGIWQTSDQRFKQNIAVIENPSDILKNIKGYRYDFKAAEFPDRNFNKGRQIGFIAQELKQVVPEAVMQGDDGYLAVNYDMMVPVLVEAYKELKDEVEALKKALMTKLNTAEFGTANTLQMECYPNPFSNNIEVKFNLAAASTVAVKIINVEGKVVSKVEESRYEAGKQKLSINTQSLPSGSYVLLINTEDGVYSHKIVCNK